MMIIGIILGLGLAIASGNYCGNKASRTRRNPFLWSVFGLLLAPIAVPLAWFLVSRNCPYCSSALEAGEKRCPNCKAYLDTPEAIEGKKGQRVAFPKSSPAPRYVSHTPSLDGKNVQSLDDGLVVYESCDLSSSFEPVVAGIVIKLGSSREMEGREWFDAYLPGNSSPRYALAASIRSHTALLTEASPDS